jgi:hypothetical protein
MHYLTRRYEEESGCLRPSPTEGGKPPRALLALTIRQQWLSEPSGAVPQEYRGRMKGMKNVPFAILLDLGHSNITISVDM